MRVHFNIPLHSIKSTMLLNFVICNFISRAKALPALAHTHTAEEKRRWRKKFTIISVSFMFATKVSALFCFPVNFSSRLSSKIIFSKIIMAEHFRFFVHKKGAQSEARAPANENKENGAEKSLFVWTVSTGRWRHVTQHRTEIHCFHSVIFHFAHRFEPPMDKCLFEHNKSSSPKRYCIFFLHFLAFFLCSFYVWRFFPPEIISTALCSFTCSNTSQNAHSERNEQSDCS